MAKESYCFVIAAACEDGRIELCERNGSLFWTDAQGKRFTPQRAAEIVAKLRLEPTEWLYNIRAVTCVPRTRGAHRKHVKKREEHRKACERWEP